MSRALIAITLFLLLQSITWAGYDGIFIIKGEIVARDQCDYKIKQSNGKTTLLPRSHFDKFTKGRNQIYARLSESELNVALGNTVGPGVNSKGVSLGGGSNSRGVSLGGGSNSRNCKLRNQVSSLIQKDWFPSVTFSRPE
ncbi:MAG: hypothetical protein CME70_03160 [Halobacteriovorax sp.]|nr:hypothetical protein [Halobacteriovorax sp.]MBK22982.1 hypothetical protein [Halobacteriovorax sp.]|tara:strand:- start:13809 stop:14228 length:420 start_codon:yes stop_codon:yes gene_type:complete